MGVLNNSDIHNRDQDALSYRNEWAFLIMATTKWRYETSTVSDINHWQLTVVKSNLEKFYYLSERSAIIKLP